MKPFLCTDITINKKNKTKNGQEFVCKQTNEVFAQSYQSACKQYDEQNKKASKKAMPFLIIISLMELVFLVGIIFLLKLKYDEWFNSDLGMLLFMIIALTIGVGWPFFIRFLSKKPINKAKDNNDYQYANSKRLIALNAILEDLQVPQDTFDVDLLSFGYKDKEGNISRNKLKFVELYPFRLWADEKNVYLADLDKKYCFEKSSFVSIKKHYTGADVRFADKYVEYDSLDQTRGVSYYKGAYSISCYYLINYDDGTNQTCIYITQFGLESFEKATGLVFKEDMARTKPWRVK